jgi:hypothetical protein
MSAAYMTVTKRKKSSAKPHQGIKFNEEGI